MAFFRTLRNSLHLGKSSSEDSSPVSSTRPEKDNINFRRNETNSRSAYSLSRGNENAHDSNSSNPHHSDSSTVEKKLKKPKMPGKYNTLSAQPNAMSDLHSDPFSFLFEKLPTLKELRKKSANTEQHTSSGDTHKSMAATSFDSSTFKRTEDRMQSDSKKSDEGTYGNPQKSNRTEHQKDRKQSSKKESEKYCSVTINDFRQTYGEKLLDLIKEAPDNLVWFVEVEQPQPAVEEKDVRSHYELSLESRPDFLLFENENYRPLSKWTLSEHQSCRAEPFRIVPSTSAQPKPSSKKAPTKRIDHKNSIIPNVPGRFAAVGVSKPMPPSLGHNHNSTNHHTRRLTKSQSPLEASSTKLWRQ